jgi:hypothetical protein
VPPLTTPSQEEEGITVGFPKYAHPLLGDCLYPLQRVIPHLNVERI